MLTKEGEKAINSSEMKRTGRERILSLLVKPHAPKQCSARLRTEGGNKTLEGSKEYWSSAGLLDTKGKKRSFVAGKKGERDLGVGGRHEKKKERILQKKGHRGACVKVVVGKARS